MLALGISLLVAGSARAERGALVVEAGVGAEMGRSPAPHASGRLVRFPLTVVPVLRLSAAYAVTHDVELGLFLLWSTRRARRVEGTFIQGRLGTYFDRMMRGGVWGLARIFGLGMISRGFVELGAGLRAYFHDRREHLLPPDDPADPYVSYGLDLGPTLAFAPGGALALGWLKSGDRLAYGLRAMVDLAIYSGMPAWGLGLQAFCSWSFYP